MSKQPKRKTGNSATDDDYAFSSIGRRLMGITPKEVKSIKRKTTRKERRNGKQETKEWIGDTENE